MTYIIIMIHMYERRAVPRGEGGKFGGLVMGVRMTQGGKMPLKSGVDLMLTP